MKKSIKVLCLLLAMQIMITSCQLFQKPTLKMEYTEKNIERFVKALIKEVGSSMWIEIDEISADSNKKEGCADLFCRMDGAKATTIFLTFEYGHDGGWQDTGYKLTVEADSDAYGSTYIVPIAEAIEKICTGETKAKAVFDTSWKEYKARNIDEDFHEYYLKDGYYGRLQYNPIGGVHLLRYMITTHVLSRTSDWNSIFYD